MKRKALPKWVAVIMAVSLSLASVTGAAAFYTDKEESVHTAKVGDVAIEVENLTGKNVLADDFKLNSKIEITSGNSIGDIASPTDAGRFIETATPSNAIFNVDNEISDLDIFSDHTVQSQNSEDDKFETGDKENDKVETDEFGKKGMELIFSVRNIGNKSVYLSSAISVENMPDSKNLSLYKLSDCVLDGEGNVTLKDGAKELGIFKTGDSMVTLPSDILTGSAEKDASSDVKTYELVLVSAMGYPSTFGITVKANVNAVQYRNNPNAENTGFQETKEEILFGKE